MGFRDLFNQVPSRIITLNLRTKLYILYTNFRFLHTLCVLYQIVLPNCIEYLLRNIWTFLNFIAHTHTHTRMYNATLSFYKTSRWWAEVLCTLDSLCSSKFRSFFPRCCTLILTRKHRRGNRASDDTGVYPTSWWNAWHHEPIPIR